MIRVYETDIPQKYYQALDRMIVERSLPTIHRLLFVVPDREDEQLAKLVSQSLLGGESGDVLTFTTPDRRQYFAAAWFEGDGTVYRIKTQESDGEWVDCGSVVGSLERAKNFPVVRERQEAEDHVYIFSGEKIVATWVPTYEGDAGGGEWVDGDPYNPW